MTTTIEHLGVTPGNAACVPGAHTKEPWRVGRKGSVVSDCPVPEMNGSDDTTYYGGHLVAESVTDANASRIVACVNACAGIPTGALEAAGQSAVIALRPVDELVAERNALLAALEPFADIQHYSLAPDGAGFAMRSNGEAVTYGQIRAAKTVFDRVKP